MDVIRFGSLVLECSWKSLNNIENYIHVFSKSAKCIIANENQKKSCNREFMSLLLKKCIEVLATVRGKCISALIDKYNYSLTH